ncbi:Zinc-type alcohol dehydrogenase-like protein [Labrenzia sp. THAF82]|uniref:zinc-dependent alcohol dehydrogenase family protein n=1 Tax=Labrenzia sp. THAF82 TaxID=2587861 RepID=UPI001268DE78|nr:zinc-dependent alcohol dehydrogenase family protein [Labrenzia sp. THAF82]QFT30693.1 Zinc-type alcohol dehydrogenase-like protein [Labrenzia sp. THAF82]
MKSMSLNSYGADSVFELAEIDKPVAKPGHVLVRIAATSVNTVDTMIRNMGTDLPLSPALPAVLGMDFAGTVEAVGEGVAGFEAGDEVYGCAGGLLGLQGTLAQYICADARLVAHKPKALSMREAAALPLVGITAYEGLTRANVSKGQKVLIQGGAGGVGHVAVQLANHMGADVTATGTGTAQLTLISDLGARPVDFMTAKTADVVADNTGGVGFDVVFDTVGGANMANSFEAAKLNGHVSSTVALLEIDLTPAHFKGLSLHVVFMLLPMIHDVGREVHGYILKSLAEAVDAGAVKPVLDEKEFGFADVNEAYARLESGQAIGKVVIEL